MSNSDQLVCKLDDIIKQKTSEQVNAIKQNIDQKIDQVTDKINETQKNIKEQISETISNLKNQKENVINNISEKYNQTPISQWRSARPDITLLVEITILVAIIIFFYSIWPYLSIPKSPIFTNEQYLRALQLSENDFSIAELSKIRVELKALTDYVQYFQSLPFSPENQGIYDLNKGVIFLPIISFIIIYIVPPFVILYIVWFIITYWRYVIAAIWGWLVMIYRYSSTLIECKLAEKWYIRMVTGWTPCSPNFSEYFNAWRKQYVDIPVYYERLKYIQEYYAAKRKYYTIPKRYYIDLPRERYQIKTEYLRKVYVDRAIDVFLRKLVDWYRIYYELPRDELYRYLLRNNQNLAAIWSKVHQTQKQIRGLPYESATPSGAKCTCPPSQTPIKIISDMISSDINLTKDDLKTATDKVSQLYDDINQIKEKQKIKLCDTADHVVKNRNSIYLWLIFSIILFFVLLYGYSNIFGTPNWFYTLTGPIWRLTTQVKTLTPNLMQVHNDYSIYFIILIITATIGYILYKIRFW